jgi:hypothetical protein
MKYLFFLLATLCFSSNIIAQSFKVKQLQKSLGNWEGKLTYLDYTSGQPFTLLANIKINFTENNLGWITGYEYPKEPHANSTDTIYYINKQFGNETIVEFNQQKNGDFTLITERSGEDGNDHKKALLRHVYSLIGDSFTIKKEVKFQDAAIWIKRNEYQFNRVHLK